MGIDVNRFEISGEINPDLICPICNDVLEGIEFITKYGFLVFAAELPNKIYYSYKFYYKQRIVRPNFSYLITLSIFQIVYVLDRNLLNIFTHFCHICTS